MATRPGVIYYDWCLIPLMGDSFCDWKAAYFYRWLIPLRWRLLCKKSSHKWGRERRSEAETFVFVPFLFPSSVLFFPFVKTLSPARVNAKRWSEKKQVILKEIEGNMKCAAAGGAARVGEKSSCDFDLTLIQRNLKNHGNFLLFRPLVWEVRETPGDKPVHHLVCVCVCVRGRVCNDSSRRLATAFYFSAPQRPDNTNRRDRGAAPTSVATSRCYHRLKSLSARQ